MSATYTYSPIHRAVEVVSIALFFLLVVILTHQAWLGLAGPFRAEAWWVLPTAALSGWLLADFVSGVVHWLADNFGHERLPIIGQALIRPFREHHVDPRAITRHDFIETNGNNCLVCWPVLAVVCVWLPTQAHLLAAWFAVAWVVFNLGIFATNQFHKWSHLEVVPGWIAWLQDRRLILSPAHHDVHHTPPFDRYYCITTGWLNPLLCDGLRFFQRAEALIRWVTRSPKAPAPGAARDVRSA